MTDARSRLTFPRSRRIRSRKDFMRVLRLRHRLSDRSITLYAAWNDKGWTRLGISVSKRVGGAVRRNRRKRLIREAFRRVRHSLPAGLDLIAVLKSGDEPGVDELQQSIRKLAAQLVGRMPSSRSHKDR